jgi:hypothetical protein
VSGQEEVGKVGGERKKVRGKAEEKGGAASFFYRFSIRFAKP